MSVFTVITGDIINSRKSNISFQELEKKLDRFKYPEEMVTPFKILKGDEIQGVFKGFMETPQLIRKLRYSLYPIHLRIGIGIGAIEDGLDRGDSWQMNGPAFYLARNALDQVKADNDLTLTRISSSFTKNNSENNLLYNPTLDNNISDDFTPNQIINEFLDLSINTILLLIDTIQKDWTESQWEAVCLYEELGTYKKAAKKLGIAFQNVEKRCNAANWKQVEKAEINIKDIVKKWG